MTLCYKSLITPNELKNRLPISKECQDFISCSRAQISNILDGDDDRLLFIVGPCSIHDIEEAMEYAILLKALSNRVEDKFLLVMRTYFEKPRTRADWKGFLYDPKLDGSNDMEMGLQVAREFLINLAILQMPVATEILDPTVSNYLGDLISWAAIGSRTVKSQIHRQMASSIPMPVGFKNPLSGDIQVAIDAVNFASLPHTFMGVNPDGRASIVETAGNRCPHIVLRGSKDGPNHNQIGEIGKRLAKSSNIFRLLVDCSHDNSGKDIQKQKSVFLDVMDQIKNGQDTIAGVLLESNLNKGRQQISLELDAGVSITDPCLSFEDTEELILSAYNFDTKK